MDVPGANSVKENGEMPWGVDEATEGEYASQSELLQEFTSISTIDKAWTFKPENGMVMFLCVVCLDRTSLYVTPGSFCVWYGL